MDRLFGFIVLAVAVMSCSKGGFDSSSGSPDDGQVSHGMIVLGERLENPYTTENISAAIASVYPARGRVEVKPTHLYVRFLPVDQNDFDLISDLDLSDYPLDYAIVKDGDYYHDPQIDDEKVTWQYAVVPHDYVFPDIYYEVIDECFITENDAPERSADGIDWEAVEREAYRLTGNADMLVAAGARGKKVQPSGRITIVDDKLGAEDGVKGVKVSCNSFVKFAHAYTDDEGYYKVDKNFNSRPRYRIVFKNKTGFAIGFNLLLQPASASTLGKNSPKGVNISVSSSSDRKLFTRCVVNNAAYEYYRSCGSDDGDISTPPSNLRIWLFQNLELSSAPMLRQGAVVDDSVISDFLGEYTFLLKIFLPDLTIGLRGAGDYAEVYSRTVHELAHASHFMQVGKTYWNKYIKAMMSAFVNSGFTTYGNGTEENAGFCEIGEMWAYYMQSKLYRERYGLPDVAFGTSYWFYPQIMLYLDDRGLNRYKIFSSLTSDIDSREMLKKKLQYMYPEFKSAIVQAFGRYN